MTDRYCHVVGLGLIGASLALALTKAGWTVSGEDLDDAVQRQALIEGVISNTTPSLATTLVIAATPVGSVASVISRLATTLTGTDVLFTDVGQKVVTGVMAKIGAKRAAGTAGRKHFIDGETVINGH